MAEWFKATDLRPVINDAWVRTPLSAQSACTKQNPEKRITQTFFHDFMNHEKNYVKNWNYGTTFY